MGTGTLTQSGGELLATANETVTNALSLSGSSTIAAAHGTTLTENASDYSVGASTTLNFGALGQDGTILWDANGGSISSPFPAIDVQAGTLKGVNGSLSFLVDGSPIMVAGGATLDLAGSGAVFTDLTGAGSIIDSAAAATLALDATNFSGAISGPLSLVFGGDASLSGLEDNAGSATLEGSATVANSGTYDIIANNGISGTSASLFVNDGLFEKTGGGVSDVTSNFINSGTLNVLSGKVEFSGGFTNNGVIHGLVTQSGGVTTISAPVPSDFNGDSLSDILWQNTSGQAAAWDMNGMNVIARRVRRAPIPGLLGKRSGQATSTATAFPTSCGRTQRPGLDLGNERQHLDRRRRRRAPIPGRLGKRSEQAISTATALSDILLQNASSGQVSIWEMNGNTLIGGGPVHSQPRAGLESDGNGRFQRRRRCRHPVSKREHGPSLDLGNGREQTDRRRARQPQSRA